MATIMGSAGAQPSQTQSGGQGYDDGYTMGPWMMGPNGAGPMMGGRWGGQASYMCTVMTSHIEGRLAYLKTELKITDAQGSLWDAYANAARQNAQAMAAHCTTMTSKPGTAGLSLPDRLDQHEKLMAAHLDAIRAVGKTLKPLYAALSDTQKQAANQLFWGSMGMM
jgi:hypothetical protein